MYTCEDNKQKLRELPFIEASLKEVFGCFEFQARCCAWKYHR